MPTISETAGLVMVGFLVSRYQLHTVPVDVITSFQEMESQYKNTLFGVLGCLAAVYLLILAPLYHIAHTESRESSAYRYRTSSREHLRRRGSF